MSRHVRGDPPKRNDKNSPGGSWRVPRRPDSDGRVRATFDRIAYDRWVWVVADVIPFDAIAADPEALRSQHPILNEFLTQYSQADFRYAAWDQGGWADFEDRESRRIVLALASWALWRVWRAATASHELLHLARHIRGITSFGIQPSIRHTVGEELKLYGLGIAYAPLSWMALSSLIFLLLAAVVAPFAVLGRMKN